MSSILPDAVTPGLAAGLYGVYRRTSAPHPGIAAADERKEREDAVNDLDFHRPGDHDLLDDLAAYVDRLDRNHLVAIYVPTTMDVDRSADTSAYVERTLALLGQRFGGAFSMMAHGVWRSDRAMLVGEAVHRVQAYATEAALHQFLPELVRYVQALKRELRQEAVALEIDGHLLLI